MRIVCVGGARPNFVKIAPLIRAFDRAGIRTFLVHTGQHYDYALSEAFFRELKIPRPDSFLRVGSGTHAEMTAKVMMGMERVLLKTRPTGVVVVGDVNSTLAAALVASKLGIPVAHVEAGLRSFDSSMPEEINRRLTDAVSDLLFTTCREADRNLLDESVSRSRIFFVGNAMIDSLLTHLPEARARAVWERFGLPPRSYATITMHRPSNVDDPRRLREVVGMLERIQSRIPSILPAHPRTIRALRKSGLLRRFSSRDSSRKPQLIEPLGYLDFISLLSEAKAVVTDSGGIQEECAVLGVPCLTVRPNTERSITQWAGANRLVSEKPVEVLAALDEILRGRRVVLRRPPLWDGRTAERIASILQREWGNAK